MLRLERSINSYYDSQLVTANPRSVRTIKYAMGNLQAFLKKHHQITLDQAVKEFEDEQLFYDIIQSWINDNSKTMGANTVKLYFALVKPYFFYKGLKFHPMDIKQNLRFPKVLHEEKHGITIEEVKTIFDILKPRKKAFFLCQLSSGMRVGELLRMRKKHLDLTTKRITVTIPAEHNKNGRNRITFFSKEAAKYLRPILNSLDDNDLVLTKNEHWESARNTVLANMRRWIAKQELTNITTHSFRAFFITKVSRTDPNLAKRLAGQKSYLDSYDRLSNAEKLEKYIEFEPELLIFESVKKDKELTELKDNVKQFTEHFKQMTKGADVGKEMPKFMQLFLQLSDHK